MAVVDADGDGIPDVFDTFERIALMEGARIVEAMMSRRRALNERARSGAEHERQEAQARLRSEAVQSRYRLEPVLSDGWWARADLETIGRRYAEATAWDGIDPAFRPFVERIEERAKALHDLDPEHIMDAVHAADRVPLTLEEARAVAAQSAPQWYRLHDDLGRDLYPYKREQTEDRLIADMTYMRDTGRLDTDSARMEWARFLDHRPALRDQDPNESLDEWQSATLGAARENWDATVQERRAVSAPLHPDGAVAARPMSVPEARSFMEEFAPEWFKFGHAQNRNAEDSQEVAAREVHAARMDDQMRYAMENLRDTGTLSHTYAAAMRDALEAHPEVDTLEGPRTVTTGDRLRFGGSPSARPLTDGEALELMNGYAPQWYRDRMNAALSPDSALTSPQRAGQIDAIRADMQGLRDRGTLATDHARRVWASTQPGASRDDGGFGDPLATESVWAETVGRREGPATVPQEVRERFGGITVAATGSDPYEGRSRPYEGPVTGPAPEPVVPGWDDPGRRAKRAEDLAARKWSPQAIKAYLSADTATARNGSQVDPDAGRVQQKGKGRRQKQGQEHRQKM